MSENITSKTPEEITITYDTYTVNNGNCSLIGSFLTKKGDSEYFFNGTGTVVVYEPAYGRYDNRRKKYSATFSAVKISSENILVSIWENKIFY